MRTLLWSLAFSVFFFTANPALSQEEFYDEVFDKNGTVRPQYAEVYALYMQMSEREKRNFIKKSRADFLGDNALHPLPRIMTDTEVSTIREGVDQRARALIAFLKDHYSGKKSYQNANIFPPGVLEKIIARYGETWFDGKLNPSSIAFTYGPDIIRGANGKFYVIEDNPGYVGGIGDLIKAREVILKRNKQYRGVIDPLDSPELFYEQLVERYKSMRKNNGPVVLYTLSKGESADNEDVRLKKIMSDLGVEVVSPYSSKKIVIKNGKAYLESPTGRNGTIVRREIGFLALNAEPGYIDFSLPPMIDKNIIEQAREQLQMIELSIKDPNKLSAEERSWTKDLRRRPKAERVQAIQMYKAMLNTVGTDAYDREAFKKVVIEGSHLTDTDVREITRRHPQGLLELIMKGKLPSNYSPGVDFVGDKEFYLYAEKLIEYYLKEKPIIENIPTRTVNRNKRIIEEFRNNPKKFVVKPVDGRGGDGVHIGPKMKKAQVNQLTKTLAAHDGYIIQEVKNLSQMDGLIVDARMISHADSRGALVPYTPWGRGLPVDGDGKVNLSAQGREIAIMMVADPNLDPCNKTAKGAYREGVSY